MASLLERQNSIMDNNRQQKAALKIILEAFYYVF